MKINPDLANVKTAEKIACILIIDFIVFFFSYFELFHAFASLCTM